ncbi:MAG: enoyl-ACP reductase [Planctomycetota bacterium]|nr:MAG: enoyl-ACP reductase [Planctomycetota bacterium]
MGLLEGKTGLIVGIANDRSYAWHIAKSLIEQGGRCAFTHLPGDKNERRTRRAIEQLGVSDPWLVPMDASSDADLDEVFARYQNDHDRLDFLVHSIAFADRAYLQPGAFAGTPRQAYLGAIDVSAYTLLAMAHRAREQMAANGGGSIMAMSYYGAEKVVPGYNVMGVAKAALECTARYLASELGEQNIRVNVISGGYLRTLASSAVGGTDSMAEHNLQRAPLRRNVEGADVGGTAAWLASDLSRGVTGETIYVDCGVNIIGL